MPDPTCHHCETTDELRPYGPGGAPICFPCMKATPEREVEARANFELQIEASEAVSPLDATLLDHRGPNPLQPEDVDPYAGEES